MISRAAALLRELDGQQQGLSLSQLSERISLPRSTVHRLVTAIEREGFVAAASPNGRVRLGTELLRLAEGGRRDIRRELRPLMPRLFDDLNETVDLAVLDADHLRFIDQIPSPHRLRAVSAVGATFPLHCTANGKAVLAGLDDAAVKALVPARPSQYTPRPSPAAARCSRSWRRSAERASRCTARSTPRASRLRGARRLGHGRRDLGCRCRRSASPAASRRSPPRAPRRSPSSARA